MKLRIIYLIGILFLILFCLKVGYVKEEKDDDENNKKKNKKGVIYDGILLIINGKREFLYLGFVYYFWSILDVSRELNYIYVYCLVIYFINMDLNLFLF